MDERILKDFLYIFKDPKQAKQTGRNNFIKKYDKDCYEDCLNSAIEKNLIYIEDKILNKLNGNDEILAIKLTTKGNDLLKQLLITC